jgi:hypothetical protein
MTAEGVVSGTVAAFVGAGGSTGFGALVRRMAGALFVRERWAPEEGCSTASGRCSAMAYGDFAANWIVEQLAARERATTCQAVATGPMEPLAEPSGRR